MPQLHMVQTSAVPPAAHYTRGEVQAMQRAVINLGKRWEINDAQMAVLLGGLSSRTFARWKTGEYGAPSVDVCARMSNLLGIHKALRLLFKDAARGYGWIKRANDTFDGQSALEIMLRGQLTDLMRVRRYLDATRGLW